MRRKRKKKNQNLKKLSMYYFNLESYQKKVFCFTEKKSRLIYASLPLIFCPFTFQLGWGFFLTILLICAHLPGNAM